MMELKLEGLHEAVQGYVFRKVGLKPGKRDLGSESSD